MQGRTTVAAGGAAQHGRPPAPGQPLRPSVVIGEHRPVVPSRGGEQRPQVRGPEERKVSGQHRDQARVPGVTVQGGQFGQPAAQRGQRACAGWFLPDDAGGGRLTGARPASRPAARWPAARWPAARWPAARWPAPSRAAARWPARAIRPDHDDRPRARAGARGEYRREQRPAADHQARLVGPAEPRGPPAGQNDHAERDRVRHRPR